MSSSSPAQQPRVDVIVAAAIVPCRCRRIRHNPLYMDQSIRQSIKYLSTTMGTNCHAVYSPNLPIHARAQKEALLKVLMYSLTPQ